MAEVNMTKAREVYRTLLKMLDAKDWKYERHDKDLLITSGCRGEDLPVEFLIRIAPQQEVIDFRSRLPFEVPEDKRVEAAVAVCVANYRMVQGSFDYDITDGEIGFRLTSCYRDSIIGTDLLEYLMMVGISTVDRYNDKFFMLTKGVLTLEQFIEQDKN